MLKANCTVTGSKRYPRLQLLYTSIHSKWFPRLQLLYTGPHPNPHSKRYPRLQLLYTRVPIARSRQDSRGRLVAKCHRHRWYFSLIVHWPELKLDREHTSHTMCDNNNKEFQQEWEKVCVWNDQDSNTVMWRWQTILKEFGHVLATWQRI